MSEDNSKIGETIRRIWRSAITGVRKTLHLGIGLESEDKKKPQITEVTPEQESNPLTDADYEYFFMQLLEGVEHGWNQAQVLRVYDALSERTTSEEWIAWLRRFGEKLLASPVPNEQLARQMVRLGEVGCGTFGTIALGIGATLLAKTPEIPEVELVEDVALANNKTQEAQEWFHRGIEQFNAGDFLGAVASYDKAVTIVPNAHEVWYNRGNALFKLGRTQDAIASYDKALALKPDKSEAWNNRGNALFNLGCVEESIASYDKALEIIPNYHQAWFNRGVLMGNLGRLEEAIASYDKALEIKPEDDQAWFNRGLVLGNLGRLEDAIFSWDKALEYNPQRYEAWYNRSIALNNLGRTEEAAASLNKATALKSDRD